MQRQPKTQIISDNQNELPNIPFENQSQNQSQNLLISPNIPIDLSQEQNNKSIEDYQLTLSQKQKELKQKESLQKYITITKQLINMEIENESNKLQNFSKLIHYLIISVEYVYRNETKYGTQKRNLVFVETQKWLLEKNIQVDYNYKTIINQFIDLIFIYNKDKLSKQIKYLDLDYVSKKQQTNKKHIPIEYTCFEF